jgi:exosortase
MPCTTEEPPEVAVPPFQRRRQLTSNLFLAVLAFIALVGAIYWPTFVELARVWNVDPDYSHGFVVPFASLVFGYVAWQRYGGLRTDISRSAIWLGAIEIFLGLAMHLAAWIWRFLLLDVLSLILVFRGVLLVLGGRDAQQKFGFAVLFLIFMAPLPTPWYQPIASTMQQGVSALSAQLLELCGAVVYREGYFLHVRGYTMSVGQECSGLRQLGAILALALAIGYLSGRGRAYCWTLALASIPIAIVANCIRIVLTGVILMLFGQKWGEGVFHALEGLAVVGVAAAMIVCLAWGLAAWSDTPKQKDGPQPA